MKRMRRRGDVRSSGVPERLRGRKLLLLAAFKALTHSADASKIERTNISLSGRPRSLAHGPPDS